MPLEVKDQYTSIITVRNEEVRSRWTVNGFFLTLNLGVLGVLVALADTLTLGMFWAFCLFGMTFSVIWFLINDRLYTWLKYWNGHLGDIEDMFENLRNIFSGEEVRKASGPSTNDMFVLVALTFLAFWFGMLILGNQFLLTSKEKVEPQKLTVNCIHQEGGKKNE